MSGESKVCDENIQETQSTELLCMDHTKLTIKGIWKSSSLQLTAFKPNIKLFVVSISKYRK